MFLCVCGHVALSHILLLCENNSSPFKFSFLAIQAPSPPYACLSTRECLRQSLESQCRSFEQHLWGSKVRRESSSSWCSSFGVQVQGQVQVYSPPPEHPSSLFSRMVTHVLLKMQGRTSPPCTFVGRANAILSDIQVLRSLPHASEVTLDRLDCDISELASRSAQFDVPSTPAVTFSTAPWSLFVEHFVSSHDPSRIVNVTLSGLPPVPEESDIPQISLPVGRARAFSTYRRLLDSQDIPTDSWLGRLLGRSSGSRLRRIVRCLFTTDDARCLTGALRGDVPLIVDTGASVCITPCREDFVTYQPSKIKIRDLSSSNKVAGEGMVRWVVKDEQGELVTLEIPGYHIPNAEVRLLSPQVLLGLVDGDMRLSRDQVIFELDRGVSFTATFCPRSRLPVIRLFHGNCNKGFFADAFAFTNTDVTALDDNEKSFTSVKRKSLLQSKGSTSLASTAGSRIHSMDSTTPHAGQEVASRIKQHMLASSGTLHSHDFRAWSDLRHQHPKMCRMSDCQSTRSDSWGRILCWRKCR